jgi:hypothetical protein
MMQGRARQLGFVARSLLAVMALSALLGCKVNSDDIEYWRRTVKGPRKIVAVLLSDHYSLELRTRAATALVEMERNDVEGSRSCSARSKSCSARIPRCRRASWPAWRRA